MEIGLLQSNKANEFLTMVYVTSLIKCLTMKRSYHAPHWIGTVSWGYRQNLDVFIPVPLNLQIQVKGEWVINGVSEFRDKGIWPTLESSGVTDHMKVPHQSTDIGGIYFPKECI